MIPNMSLSRCLIHSATMCVMWLPLPVLVIASSTLCLFPCRLCSLCIVCCGGIEGLQAVEEKGGVECGFGFLS